MVRFDCVVMLTWSDWHSEPRSNRYHYATRFARDYPVYFIQPDGQREEVSFEQTEVGITIVHIADDYGPVQADRLAKALRTRGVTRPLVWVYNLFMVDSILPLHPTMTVYHATEDYAAPADTVRITQGSLREELKKVISKSNLVVAVSEGVAETHRPLLVPGCELVVLNNGCDFEFWDKSQAWQYLPPTDQKKVAFFQGGINNRLDFQLLIRLADLMPNWQFWFCGRLTEDDRGWEILNTRKNVTYFGELSSAGIADLARKSVVGIIPFKSSDLMRRSLPLKAYEYVACGLPVVSTPIDALIQRPDLFSIAQSAGDFKIAIENLESTRNDPDVLKKRRDAAFSASYDKKFLELKKIIASSLEVQSQFRAPLNILMLYDDRSTHVGTILEHIEAFKKYSVHNIKFMAATGSIGSGGIPNLASFDAVIIHYSVRVSILSHLSPFVAKAVTAYRGLKILFIQDEYDQVEISRKWIEQLGINVIYTCVPLDSVERVYPKNRFPHLTFVPTLTGYVPEDPRIERFVQPMRERQIRIAYRGRMLPHHYGALGFEKYEIGVTVRRIADSRGIPVDIEVDDARRIYGIDWYRFLGSARATLGTESGANVFDFHGDLAALAEKHKSMPFKEFSQRFLTNHEGFLRMNQISPKIFEAIRLRTALVLFEGNYSGVVEANKHYIPLAKDFSNLNDVLLKLENVDFLERLTSRAYQDIVSSGKFSYKSFITSFDDDVFRLAGGQPRALMVSIPVITMYDEANLSTLNMAEEDTALISDVILGPHFSRDVFERLKKNFYLAESKQSLPTKGIQDSVISADTVRVSGLYIVLRFIWKRTPYFFRVKVVDFLRSVSRAKLS